MTPVSKNHTTLLQESNPNLLDYRKNKLILYWSNLMWFFETGVTHLLDKKYQNRGWVGITETWYIFSLYRGGVWLLMVIYVSHWHRLLFEWDFETVVYRLSANVPLNAFIDYSPIYGDFGWRPNIIWGLRWKILCGTFYM